MKVIIWTDMEGVAGIVAWDQVTGGKSLYEEGRRLLTEEINAAVRGAKKAGAKQIVVLDCHGAGGGWTFNSFIPELLEEGAEYVSGSPWGRYTKPLEEGCDAALLVGMHAKAGTPDGVLCHTVSGTEWTNCWFNDTLVGESGINAALSGHWNVPVLLATGDEATCRECTDLLGKGLTTVAVKKGINRYSAQQLPPKTARKLIEEGARKALKNLKAVRPYKPAQPCTITVEFATPDRVTPYLGRKGVKRIGDRKITSRAPTWWEAWDQFWHPGP